MPNVLRALLLSSLAVAGCGSGGSTNMTFSAQSALATFINGGAFVTLYNYAATCQDQTPPPEDGAVMQISALLQPKPTAVVARSYPVHKVAPQDEESSPVLATVQLHAAGDLLENTANSGTVTLGDVSDSAWHVSYDVEFDAAPLLNKLHCSLSAVVCAQPTSSP